MTLQRLLLTLKRLLLSLKRLFLALQRLLLTLKRLLLSLQRLVLALKHLLLTLQRLVLTLQGLVLSLKHWLVMLRRRYRMGAASTLRERVAIVPAVRFGAYFALLPLLFPFTAEASAGAKEIVVPGGGGQSSLHAAIAGNELVFRACPAEPCPASAKDGRIQIGDGAEVSLQALAIGSGRHVLWAHGPSFDAIVAAVPDEPSGTKLLFSGPTGFQDGLPGERRGPLLQVTEPAEDGSVHVLMGEQREDVTICGRPTILSPRVLDPKDLSWKPAKVQRLGREEREAAARLVAQRQPDGPTPSLVPLLRARVATSAVGDPGALTDGDLETTWAEGRKGDGRGELVQLDVAEDVPISAMSFVLRPKKRAIPRGAAPSRFWLATSDELFSVSLPADAWSKPGASFEIRFDPPLETRCMTIVLDETKAQKDVEVTFAELIARTPFDEAPDPEALVGALAGGGTRARAARAMLQRAGERAFVATAERFGDLDEAGRSLALEVLDVAPCRISAPVYLEAAGSGSEGQAHHARDRLRRCGPEAKEPLLRALAEGPDPARTLAAEILALSAPDAAIAAILAALPESKGKTRIDLRLNLARAAASPRATEALRESLLDESLSAEAALTLLRSLPARPELLQAAEAAFERALGPSPDFRARYLLLEPAARLARQGAPKPLASLREALVDSADRHLRARAAEVAEVVPSLAVEVVEATRDAEPRVRLAALGALGKQASRGQVAPQALEAVVHLLNGDAWTFVRANAADALAVFPQGIEADQALGAALADAMPQVRARAVEAIGKRGATSQVELVRQRLEDKREFADVRARAARALGELCDAGSADKLAKLVREGATPLAHVDAQTIAMASIAALGRLKPHDLKEKLAPLFSEGAPRILSIAARAALDRKDVCSR